MWSFIFTYDPAANVSINAQKCELHVFSIQFLDLDCDKCQYVCFFLACFEMILLQSFYTIYTNASEIFTKLFSMKLYLSILSAFLNIISTVSEKNLTFLKKNKNKNLCNELA